MWPSEQSYQGSVPIPVCRRGQALQGLGSCPPAEGACKPISLTPEPTLPPSCQAAPPHGQLLICPNNLSCVVLTVPRPQQPHRQDHVVTDAAADTGRLTGLVKSWASGSRGSPPPGLLPQASLLSSPAPSNAKSGCGSPPVLPEVLISIGDERERVLGLRRPWVEPPPEGLPASRCLNGRLLGKSYQAQLSPTANECRRSP